MCSGSDTSRLRLVGFPIRKSPGHSLLNSLPRLIAVGHVLHRHPMPRHPPCTLHSLNEENTNISSWINCCLLVKTAIDHYADFKVQAEHRNGQAICLTVSGPSEPSSNGMSFVCGRMTSIHDYQLSTYSKVYAGNGVARRVFG